MSCSINDYSRFRAAALIFIKCKELKYEVMAFQDEVTADIVSVRYFYKAADGRYYDLR